MIKRALCALLAVLFCLAPAVTASAADEQYLATVTAINAYYDGAREKVCFEISFDGVVLDTHTFTLMVRCDMKQPDGSYKEGQMFGMHTLKFSDCLAGDDRLVGEVALGKAHFESSDYKNWDIYVMGKKLSTSSSADMYSINNASAPISSSLLGDANGDGKVNSLDAAWVLRFDAGLSETVGNADVNRNGRVDNLDAAIILRYDAGLISRF